MFSFFFLQAEKYHLCLFLFHLFISLFGVMLMFRNCVYVVSFFLFSLSFFSYYFFLLQIKRTFFVVFLPFLSVLVHFYQYCFTFSLKGKELFFSFFNTNRKHCFCSYRFFNYYFLFPNYALSPLSTLPAYTWLHFPAVCLLACLYVTTLCLLK